MSIPTLLLGSVAALAALSVLLRRPWTARFARRHTPPELWSTQLFLATNMVLSGAWAVLFALAATLAALAPLWLNVVFGVALFLLGRASPRFGAWYAARRRSGAAPPSSAK